MATKKQPEVHKQLLLEALEKTLGVVTPACKEVGIHRDRFYTYYKEDPEFKRAVDEIQKIQGDFVESQLFKKIKEGSEKSILFYMRYKGRQRGYSEEININQTGVSEVTVRIINDKSELDNDKNDDLGES